MRPSGSSGYPIRGGNAMATSQTGRLSAGGGGLPRWGGAALGAGAVAVMVAFGGSAALAATTVNLGNATPFAVLAGSGVTNTGSSIIHGDVGADPTPSITGFPPGTVEAPSTTYAANAIALGAQNDLKTAYNQAAGEGPVTSENADLTGLTLTPGVYQTSSDGALSLSGTLTLNAQGVSSAVFIFQTGSALVTGTSSRVLLTGGASECNVFWQVGSSATLNGPTFVGTVMALTSITLGSGVTVDGRVLARNGDVTLIDDTINPAPFIATTAAGVPNTGATRSSLVEAGVLMAVGGLALVGTSVAIGTLRRRRVLSRWT